MPQSTPPLRLTTVTGGSKGRSFTGVLSAVAFSRTLWPLGNKEGAMRPIMAVLTASAQEVAPLLANLKDGTPCVLSGGTISDLGSGVSAEFPRRAGYHWSPPQPLKDLDAVCHHVHLSELYAFVPVSPDAAAVKFVVMPAHADLDDVLRLNHADLEDARAHAYQLDYPARDLAALGVTPHFIALAAVWAKTLQRRTIWAVPQKLAFRVQLLLACLKHGVVTTGDREPERSYTVRSWWNSGRVDFTSWVHDGLRMHTGLATSVPAEALEGVLAEEVGRFDYMRRKKSAAVAGAPAVGMQKKVA